MASAPMTTPADPSGGKLRPSVAGYWIGGAIIVVGIVGAIVWFVLGFVGISNVVDDFERVPADGGGTISLDGDRNYVIYVEEDDVFGSGVRVRLSDPDGNDVDIDTYATELTYDSDGRSGRAVFTFRSGEPGDYTLTAEGPRDVELAVGSSVAGDLVRTIAIPFVLGGLGLLVGVLLLVVTLVRRSGAKKRRAAAATPSTHAPGPAGYGPPPGFPPGLGPPGPPPSAPPPPPR